MRPFALAALLLCGPVLAQDAPADSTAPVVPTIDYAPPEPPRDRTEPTERPTPSPTPRIVEVFGEFGVALGGDDVATLVFTDGSDQTLTAGQGGMFRLGASVQPVQAIPVSAFASAGFKFLLNASDNADVRITRVPVEAGLAVHVTRDVWAEASVVRHLNTALKGDDFFQDVAFESSTGVAVGAGWRWIGARYESIRYTDDASTEVDASSVGVAVRLRASDL